MLETLPAHLTRAALGFLLGALLGLVARRGRFCTLGAVEDAVYARDTRRARAWMLAAGLAILGTHLLEAYAGLDLARSIYAGPRLEWGALVVGGTMFGFGMALVGTCGFGALLRLGGGDLRALLVLLVLGLSAYMAVSGLTGLARVALAGPLSVELGAAGAQRLGALLGLDRGGTAALGIAAPLHLPFREAPHRGYASAPELFADLRADDSIDRDIAPALGDLLATEAPDLILAPQAVGGHVDHVQMVRALRSLRPGAPILWWRDFPYTVREATPKEPLAGLFADMPLHALSFEGGAQGRKLAACAAYTSQIGFQFGGEAGLAETLAREGGVERYRLSGRLPEPFPARDAS